MDCRPIIMLLLLAAGATAFGQAYTWTDENGVVHFSDRPHPGARQIDLPKQQSRSRQPLQRDNNATTADDAAAESTAPFRYESVEIVQPGAEETLWNIGGQLSVSVNVTPALRPGHQVRVYYDGTPQMVRGTSFQLQEVWRGVHNLQVEILDENGEVMTRSQPNRFYVQQSTVN